MKHPDYDYVMVMERRRDELAAAEQSRLIKEARLAARAARRANAGLSPAGTVMPRMRQLGEGLVLSLARLLSSAGAWLLSLSCRLQTRVEMLREGAAEKQPSPCT